MNTPGRFILSIFLAVFLSIPIAPASFGQSSSARDLAGLWKAKKRFGPDAGGPLLIQKSGGLYVADLAGRVLPVVMDGNELTVSLPDNQGLFRGRFEGKNITGHWFQPRTPVNGNQGDFTEATRVLLTPSGSDRWGGSVVPVPDEFTLYLSLEERPDGSFEALLRNPERDMGNQLGVERLTRAGNVVKLIGKRRGQKEGQELATGTYDPENGVISLYFSNRGFSYDFERDGDDSDFYSRGRNPGRYSYRIPADLGDGWPVASLDDAGIDRDRVEKLVQAISETPETSAATPQLQGLLIARHGKLVLEEYFHGFGRDELHNLRSAAKSITATLAGAAIEAGAPLTLSSPVYQVMNGGTFPAGLEPGKRAMTLENLLMMSSGLFCDDNNEEAPGREDLLWEQTEEKDFYRFYMRLPMDRKPGEKAVYCSGDANLALGMIGRAAGDNPLYLFDRLLGEPMNIRRYGWPLDPARQPYGGGGMTLGLRDFMKFGQLMLNGGTWQGRRILSRDFVARASSPLTQIGSRKYGYLWWGLEFPCKDGKIYGFAALGAGGQNVIVIPDLDLVVAAFNGSFASKGYRRVTDEIVPEFILPAVRDGKVAAK